VTQAELHGKVSLTKRGEGAEPSL